MQVSRRLDEERKIPDLWASPLWLAQHFPHNLELDLRASDGVYTVAVRALIKCTTSKTTPKTRAM